MLYHNFTKGILQYSELFFSDVRNSGTVTKVFFQNLKPLQLHLTLFSVCLESSSQKECDNALAASALWCSGFSM
jgi:hypothetical protein